MHNYNALGKVGLQPLKLGVFGAAIFSTMLSAAQLTIPASSLVSSNSLYTNNFGSVVVTTDGGNAANVGQANGRNDDGFSGPTNLGFTLSFYGQNYTQFFINNNGNVSFGAGISEYVPTGPTGANVPVISPFFADVDSRGTNSGVVHLSQSVNQDIVTWDHVGYYNGHDDKLNTFQLILRGPGYDVPAGEGQIGFFYTSMQWDSTDTSTVAAIGFGDGAGNSQVLEGSIQPGTAALVQNHHIWFSLNGGTVTPVPPTTEPTPPSAATPEPGSTSLIVAGLGGLVFFGRRKYRSSATK
ncbi:MAG: PEP-CTERM sorting domain-containing protein [Bryobacteraceae bacterium]